MKLICCADDAASDTEKKITATAVNSKTTIKWAENGRFLFFKVLAENGTPSEFIKQTKKNQSNEEKKLSYSSMSQTDIAREAQILKNLQLNTNIIKLLDSSPRQGSLTFRYHAFDLDVWLDDHQSRGKFVSKSSAGHISEGITSAIEYCHIKGIAHRDIKPQNILLDDHLNPKLTDFEFAVQFTPTQDNHTTFEIPLEPVGTTGYLSPLLTRAFLDHRAGKETNENYNPLLADLFALGVTLYLMLEATFNINVTLPFQLPPTISTHDKQPDTEISSRLNDFSDHEKVVNAISNHILDNIGVKSWNLILTLLQAHPPYRQNATWAKTQTTKITTSELLDPQAEPNSGCCIS